MFSFKKSMGSVLKKEDFECECCGSMEEQAQNGASACASACGSKEDKAPNGTSGCGSGCGPGNNSCR